MSREVRARSISSKRILLGVICPTFAVVSVFSPTGTGKIAPKRCFGFKIKMDEPVASFQGFGDDLKLKREIQ
jgi:hypothetical protein